MVKEKTIYMIHITKPFRGVKVTELVSLDQLQLSSEFNSHWVFHTSNQRLESHYKITHEVVLNSSRPDQRLQETILLFISLTCDVLSLPLLLLSQRFHCIPRSFSRAYRVREFLNEQLMWSTGWGWISRVFLYTSRTTSRSNLKLPSYCSPPLPLKPITHMGRVGNTCSSNWAAVSTYFRRGIMGKTKPWSFTLKQLTSKSSEVIQEPP